MWASSCPAGSVGAIYSNLGVRITFPEKLSVQGEFLYRWVDHGCFRRESFSVSLSISGCEEMYSVDINPHYFQMRKRFKAISKAVL
jgi:hypothetical protein